MAKQPKRGELKQRNSVAVKYEHLHPAVQRLIESKEVYFPQVMDKRIHQAGVKALRRSRLYTEGIISAAAVMALGSARNFPGASGVSAGIGGIAIGGRGYFTDKIQDKHEELKEAMNKFSILQPQHEDNYPFSWHNPTIVAQTHPIFYVKGNGDVVFRRSTRTEYLRYLAQKNPVVKGLGLNPWRWRAYLAPPTAPEKVRVWARAKLAAAKAALRPVPHPMRVPVASRRRT